ncbi:hypothetical protein [Embleya sp. NBC_00896]|uniref:hypothetical protein n=1 Tax=Embleya sp. NBC_00896 TaxID=2975961 RepID=UPI002F90C01E|nr:hypothetical protein OG928_34095 [Embleya sp. NBC_00896]
MDALITLPFVVDVAGNAADLYDRVAWFDDACHFGNWAVLGTACAVALRRWSTLPAWAVAWCCAGAGAATAILWEFFEYGAFVLATPESVSIYRDTVGDLFLGLLGASAAGAVAGCRARRQHRDRHRAVAISGVAAPSSRAPQSTTRSSRLRHRRRERLRSSRGRAPEFAYPDHAKRDLETAAPGCTRGPGV